MKKLALLVPVAFLSLACGAAPGYLNTDVMAPENLGNPVAAGVRVQGELMTDGTLTCQGAGEVHKAYTDYVEAMRGQGWEPRSADGDDVSSMKCSLKKDTRQVDVAITAEGNGAIKVVVTVGTAK
ncbi:MAG: hypothetical protein AAB074_15555 [Planctomycetota bacterium]